MRDKITMFFTLVWVIILILCHMGIHADAVTALILIILWWVITITVCEITLRHDEKKRRQREKEYREKYISDLIIEDATYGKMHFEKDSFRNCVELVEMNLPKFRNDTIDELIINDYDENKKDIYFRGLDYLYSNAEKISDELCDMVKECYESEDINVSVEDIKNQISISYIDISLNDKDECIIELCGYINNDISDHIAEHGITAYINCTAGKFEYYSG